MMIWLSVSKIQLVQPEKLFSLSLFKQHQENKQGMQLERLIQCTDGNESRIV